MSTEKFSFGNGTCNPHIEVDAFEPVCAHDEIPGSEPLTLEVPVPTFVPIVPPPECTCLTFQQSDRISRVSMTMRRRSTITDKSPLKNTAKTTIEAQGDCCDGTYDIGTWITLEVPECLHADGLIDSKTYNFNDDAASGISGSITIETWMKDCVPVLKVTGEPLRVHIDPPIISIPPLCINPADITVKPVYYTRDEDGRLVSNADDENSGTTVHMSVTDGVGGCKQLSFSNGEGGAVTLDLTGLSTFGNGGSVAQLDDHNLYIDGAVDKDLPGYFGGGYGDWKVGSNNVNYDKTFSRGPLMRYTDTEGAADPSPVLSGSVNQYTVPVEAVDTYFAVATETNDSTTWDQSKTWQSARRSACNDQDTGKNCRTVVGNLDVIWPTGIQWSTDGLSLALPLTDFLFNESGILSEAQETGVAARVSPGPATTLAYGNGAMLAGENASGLVSRAKDSAEAARISDGLRVNAGAGLRIYGLLDGRVASDDAGGGSHTATTGYDSARQGQLEVMYGPGFRIRAANSGTTPQYRDKPVDEDGALVPNEGRGLRVHGVTKMGSDSTDAAHKNELEVFGHSGDFKFNYDGKMVINDEKTNTNTITPIRGEPADQQGATFTRNGDVTFITPFVNPTTGGWISPTASGHETAWLGHCTLQNTYQTNVNALNTLVTNMYNAIHGNNNYALHASDVVSAFGDIYSVLNAILAWCHGWYYGFTHIGTGGTILAIDNKTAAPAATDRHHQASAPTP